VWFCYYHKDLCHSSYLQQHVFEFCTTCVVATNLVNRTSSNSICVSCAELPACHFCKRRLAHNCFDNTDSHICQVIKHYVADNVFVYSGYHNQIFKYYSSSWEIHFKLCSFTHHCVTHKYNFISDTTILEFYYHICIQFLRSIHYLKSLTHLYVLGLQTQEKQEEKSDEH